MSGAAQEPQRGLLAWGLDGFNVGLAAVMTMQGVGASRGNVGAGHPVAQGGYGPSHLGGGGVALVAVALFLFFRRKVAPPVPERTEHA